MKYNIKKHQLGGTVLNSRVVSGLKNKDGRIGWDSNFNITQPNKQAVLLPNITVTPSTSNTNLQEEVNTWNKKYPQTTSEIPRVATSQGGRMSFTQKPKVIGMSGADPIGQFIVEGVALGKPTQYLLDKSLQGLAGKTSGELLNTVLSKTKSSYYNKAPWTFKPNPNSYYRAIPREAIDDAIETGVIRHKPIRKSVEVTKGVSLSRGSGSKTGQTYFLKGYPWTQKYSKRYGKPNTGNYGDYFIEASDNVPFIPVEVKGRLIPEVMKNLEKNYNPEIKGIAIPKANVLPEKVIPLDENVKLYKPDWFYGFKQVQKPKTISNNQFKSEIDWRKWNKEIPQNKKLLNEYNEIEKSAKESGNWMKNPDGTDFKGTPEQFIQQKSSNFKKAFSNTKILDKYNNPQINYHGGRKDIDYFMEPSDPSFVKNKGINSGTGDYGIYFSGDKNIAKQYLKGYKKPDRQLYETYINIENPYKTNSFFGLDIKQKFNKEYFNPRKITKYNINKISDSDGVIWQDMKGEIIPIKSNQIKSATGNNGMFDMTNPNIYKTITGISAGLGALKLNKQ